MMSISSDNSAQAAVRMAAEACNAAANGDLERRILHIDRYEGFEELFNAINRLIDRSEAYVHESEACVAHAARGKYYRRIQEGGMVGAFGRASRTINAAIQSMADEAAAPLPAVQGGSSGVTDIAAAPLKAA